MLSYFVYFMMFAFDLLLIGYLLIKFSNPLPTFKDLKTGKSETIIMFIKKRHLKYALDQDLYRTQSWENAGASDSDDSV